MKQSSPTYATVDNWIKDEAITIPLDDPARVAAVVDALIGALDQRINILGFGEALHGGEEILLLRNRLFQRLVEAHGYSAIAIESSFSRGSLVNQYVLGQGPDSYGAIEDAGFSNDFGRLAANRELIEWMRQYNTDPSRRINVHFYGFDMPLVASGPASPHLLLHGLLDYLARSERDRATDLRQRSEQYLGQDADWEAPLAWRDPQTAPGLLARVQALRLITEDLIGRLRINRPGLAAKSGNDRYARAMHDASMVRELLNFFVALAEDPGYTDGLAIRDAQMADNLLRIAAVEQERGKVLIFAANSHLLRGRATVPFGPSEVATWWPAGAQIATILGSRYAVIGSAVGVSEENGIGLPEDGTLEARLLSIHDAASFIPTRLGEGLPAAAIAALPTRSGSVRNSSYVPLNARSFTDFDWLAILPSVTYWRGGRPLPD